MDAKGVSLAITFGKAVQQLQAIRGGGHSSSGASSHENGIIIDLSRHLNGVWIDPEKKFLYASGGVVWKAFDQATIEHGLATVGGTVNHVSFLSAVWRLNH